MRVFVEGLRRHRMQRRSHVGHRHGVFYDGRGGGLVRVLFEVALIAAAHAAVGCRGERTATVEGPPLTIAPPSDAPPSQRDASNEAGLR